MHLSSPSHKSDNSNNKGAHFWPFVPLLQVLHWSWPDLLSLAWGRNKPVFWCERCTNIIRNRNYFWNLAQKVEVNELGDQMAEMMKAISSFSGNPCQNEAEHMLPRHCAAFFVIKPVPSKMIMRGQMAWDMAREDAGNLNCTSFRTEMSSNVSNNHAVLWDKSETAVSADARPDPDHAEVPSEWISFSQHSFLASCIRIAVMLRVHCTEQLYSISVLCQIASSWTIVWRFLQLLWESLFREHYFTIDLFLPPQNLETLLILFSSVVSS